MMIQPQSIFGSNSLALLGVLSILFKI